MDILRINKFLGSVHRELSEAMYSIEAGGLKPIKTGTVTIQKDTLYPLGASSSPSNVLVTRVTDDRFWYKHSPFTRETKEVVIDRRIGEHLIQKGIETWLSKGYVDRRSGMARSLRSMLKGGKGKVERLGDFEQVTVLADNAPSQKGKDLWRRAEDYGSVGGYHPYEDEKMLYIIRTTMGDLRRLKKDKNFKIIKIADGHRSLTL